MEIRRLFRKLNPMNKTLLFAMLFSVQGLMAQKYITRSGSTIFKASVEAFESIEAINESSSAILNDNGDFAALLLIKGFHFKIALMQEHFNENYMDSDEFPKATFKGKLIGFSIEDIHKREHFPLEGMLTIKGKNKEIKTKAIVSTQNNKIRIKASFNVNPQNFNINIPNIVRKKIAKEISISINYEFEKK